MLKRHTFDRARYEKQASLLRMDMEKMTQRERDMWILEYIITSIGAYSRWYRMGFIKSLRRTVEVLKSVDKAERGKHNE